MSQPPTNSQPATSQPATSQPATSQATTAAPPPPRAGASVLRYRDFRLFVLARFFSSVGFQMLGVAVGWQVYALTRDPMTLGLVGLAQFLPAVILSLPAGQVADRVERKRILQVTALAQMLAALGLLGLALLPRPPLAAIYAALAGFAAARAFMAPAGQALVPLLVPKEEFPQAVAWSSTSWQVAVITGPALGGLLYALGPVTVYGVTTLLLGLAALSVGVMGIRLAVAGTGARMEGVLDGVRYVFANREILGAVSLDLFAVLFGGATALLPVFARDILHIGPWGLGMLRSAPAVGAAVMAVTLAHRPLGGRAGHKMFLAVALFGLATIVFGLSSNVWLSLGALAVLGAADMISVMVRQTLVQIRTPDAMRGRVSAVNMIFIGASNELGEFESGLTASWFGTVPAVVFGGLGTLAVVAFWAWRFPDLRRVDRLEG